MSDNQASMTQELSEDQIRNQEFPICRQDKETWLRPFDMTPTERLTIEHLLREFGFPCVEGFADMLPFRDSGCQMKLILQPEEQLSLFEGDK